MRILIADDEAKARRRLAAMLANQSGIELCGEAADGISALEAIERENPDVVLLDVQMPGLDGFEVIRELSELNPPLIVFVTGYDKYAIQAFEVSAVDFLLKPVTEDRLNQALEKVRRMLQRKSPVPGDESIQPIRRLSEALAAGQTAYLQRVVGRRSSKLQVLAVSDIEAFLCTDEQVYAAISGQQRFLLHHKLKDLEARLDPDWFLRVHKQAIVNIAHIAEIEPRPQGNGSARLKCGLTIDVSRRYGRVLKERLTY